MKLCLAQICPIKGDIDQNIEIHKQWIQQASDSGSDLICFPELSLTGYEPTLAKTLSCSPDDERWSVFDELSKSNSITIALGLPLEFEEKLGIGMLIFSPYQKRQTYIKQHLHEDELPFFSPGKEQVIIKLKGFNIAPAICYESMQVSHLQKALENGADVYLASVAKDDKGVEKGYQHYPMIAEKYKIPVLMVNSIGECDNFFCAGRSSVWNQNGIQIECLLSKNEDLLIYDLNKSN